MRVNELQIGDWILWFNKPCKVDLPLLNTVFSDRDESDNIQPIPITAEILEKNGFKYDSSIRMWLYGVGNKYGVGVGLWGDCGVLVKCYKQGEYYMRKMHLPHTPFVHQLQQAIRLCGIDKQIEV